MLEGLREPSESSSLEGRVPDPSPPRQGAEVLLAQGLRRLPEPKDLRRRRVKIAGEGGGGRGGCCSSLRRFTLFGRSCIRRRTFGRSLWDIGTSRVD